LKYRSKADIIAMVLTATTYGETKMKIMSKAHLNNSQIKRYVPALLAQRLIKEKNESKSESPIYLTTEKGLKFLEMYKKGRLFDLTSSNRVVGKIESI
jgi:predicted transcriptional regulator